MNLTQAYYESRFENLFRAAKGNEFQSLFERLMGLAYKADFMVCRPWGNRGDRKNDIDHRGIESLKVINLE